MTPVRWSPHVTVAALIQRSGRFLLVEEETADGLRLNQPAGHLEEGESLVQAVAREALEETARVFVPRMLVGVYLTRLTNTQGKPVTYLRFAFCGDAGIPEPGRGLDEGIVRTVWLTPDEIRAEHARLRSPLVLHCIDDYLSGRRFCLDALVVYPGLAPVSP